MISGFAFLFQEHEENCPGRVNVELFMASDASNQKQTQVVSVNSTISLTSTVQSRPDEENWDNQVRASMEILRPCFILYSSIQAAVPSYNYKKKVNNSDCLRNIQHGTPSQMKMWREKEHHRISNIREFENISSASNMDMTSSASSTLP